MPVQVVTIAPSHHEEWLGAIVTAVGRVLSA
jgi:hypothetical protein